MNKISSADKRSLYTDARQRIEAVLQGETDWIAAMATVACELHHTFDYFHWTGFYRTTQPELLVIGPYQGGHACLRIPFNNGICGAAARLKKTQLVEDVHAREDHIACASTTLSEIVVPIFNQAGEVMAVLDVDSDNAAAFCAEDQKQLEAICEMLGRQFGETSSV